MIRRRAYVTRSRPARAAVGQVPRKGLARHARVVARNVKRHKSEWARAFHSAARVAFVKSLPCVACGHEPPPRCENAHTRSGGAGRKADYTTIVPLCRQCHLAQHSQGWRAVVQAGRMSAASVKLFLAYHAEQTEKAWQTFSGDTTR